LIWLFIFPVLQILTLSAGIQVFYAYPVLGCAALLISAFFLNYSIHVTLHECVHQYKTSRVFSLPSIALSWIAGLPFDGYRLHHFNHHEYNNSPQDYSSTLSQKAFYYSLGWPYFLNLARLGIKRGIMAGTVSRVIQKRISLQKWSLLALLIGLYNVNPLAMFFYLSHIYVGWVFSTFQNFVQHSPKRNEPTTTYHKKWYNKLFFNNGLHWEHHDNPTLPWSQIKARYKMHFKRELSLNFQNRTILGRPFNDYLNNEIAALGHIVSEWTVKLDGDFLFDKKGLQLIVDAIKKYRGSAATLKFKLVLDDVTYRDYYSIRGDTQSTIDLPCSAERFYGEGDEILDLNLPVDINNIPYPSSLAPADKGSLPHALLLPVITEFDILFAHQILILIQLKERASQNLTVLLRALFVRKSIPYSMRVALLSNVIQNGADVHPTAVIEGSFVEKGARIGAHCVVRFSHIASDARLHDGAKVELSYVGAKSWLMHDLVFYRSYTEDNVFLIHGPYQFSGFHRKSAAFATILMDYRPDAKPIQVSTDTHVYLYQGRFLGSILKEGAKTLGGSLVGPGLVIPQNSWLKSPPDSIHTKVISQNL